MRIRATAKRIDSMLQAHARVLLRSVLFLVALSALAACPKRVEPSGTGPPRPFQLLASAAERETTQINDKRVDLEIDTRDFERTPRVVATGETPVIKLDGMRAKLYGDAERTQGWSVDNFVLLEVLSP